jgi:hypothetical protein
MRSGAAVIALQYGEVPLRSARSRLGERAGRARLDRWQETLATVTSRPPIRAPHGLNGTLRQTARIVCRSKEAALGIKQRRRCRRKYASCLRSARRFGLSIHTSPSLPRDPQRHRRRATCRSGFMGRHGADRAGSGKLDESEPRVAGLKFWATESFVHPNTPAQEHRVF